MVYRTFVLVMDISGPLSFSYVLTLSALTVYPQTSHRLKLFPSDSLPFLNTPSFSPFSASPSHFTVSLPLSSVFCHVMLPRSLLCLNSANRPSLLFYVSFVWNYAVNVCRERLARGGGGGHHVPCVLLSILIC